MALKIKNSDTTIVILSLVVLCIIAFLYSRYYDKIDRVQGYSNYDSMIRQYLARHDSPSLADKKKKPLLWIPICYDINARKWESFGSRNTTELNQPYLYLTIKSIIRHCNDSFQICLIDDESFPKLLPQWDIDMTKIGSPIVDKIRQLGLMKILYTYGGMIVPPSFLCMRDLNEMYSMGTAGNMMFVVENIDRNSTSVKHEFFPDVRFCGAPKELSIVKELMAFMEQTISTDYTAESIFLGEYNRWINVRRSQIKVIDGKLIGVKTMHDEMILIDNLLSNDYLDIYPQTYGIYIPQEEILGRRNYEWFARLSPKQVLTSNTILGKYILLASTPDMKGGVIESMETNPNWVAYWNVPSGSPVWGLMPNYLGNNLIPHSNYNQNT
jgi:hypothetical protein